MAGSASETGDFLSTIMQDVDSDLVAELGDACAQTARMAPDGVIHFAYVARSQLYHGWEGMAPPSEVIVPANVLCDEVAIAFKPNGSPVVGWIDVRNQWSSRDGSWAGLDVFIAAQDDGWRHTLVSGATDQSVRQFAMEIDGTGAIHIAYIRSTMAEHPYNDAVFYAASPSWQEIRVSNGVGSSHLDMALDSGTRAHVAWSYWENTESVWYANQSTGWTDVRVDTGPSSNWWDDRRDPSLAVDPQGAVHIVWQDFRNPDPSGSGRRSEIWYANSSARFANSNLLFPGDPPAPTILENPCLEADGTGQLHLALTISGPAWGDSNLFYANSSSWSQAVKLTNQTAENHYGASFLVDPIVVRQQRVTLLYADWRMGLPALWKSSDWDFGPDRTPPSIRPLKDLTVPLSRPATLTATGAWDNDRLVRFRWDLTGPARFSLEGRSVGVNFTRAGTYDANLTVWDPVGLEASRGFRINVLEEVPAVSWVLDKPLYAADRALGFLSLVLEAQDYALFFFPWNGRYSVHDGTGKILRGPVFIPASVEQGSGVFDDKGDLHLAGYAWQSRQLLYTKISADGSFLISGKTLALGGLLPQVPKFAFGHGKVWVQWLDQRDGNFEIYMAGLDREGNVEWGPTRVSKGPHASYPTKLVLDQDRLWVVWRDERHGYYGSYASILNLTTLGFEVSEARIGEGMPVDADALPTGGIALAQVIEGGGLQVGRIGPGGAREGETINVSFADPLITSQASVAAAFDGSLHVVWWEGTPNGFLRYARIGTGGTVEPFGGSALRPSAGDDLPSVALVIGSDGEPRIAYAAGSAWTGATIYFAYRDPIAPVVSIVAPAEAPSQVAVTFDGSGSTDNGAIVEYLWDFGDGNTSSGAVATHSFATPGNYEITLRVMDEAGNEATGVHGLAVLAPSPPENQRPVVDISAPAAGALLAGVITLRGTASDPDGDVVAVELRVDAGSWRPASGTNGWTFTVDTVSLQDGPHAIAARSFDGAAYSMEIHLGVRVDNTKPVTTATPSGTAGEGGWYVSPVSIRLRAEDATSGVSSISYRFDGGPWRTYAEPFTMDVDGTHTLEFYGTDAAGNREDIRSMTVKIDNTKPVTTATPTGTAGEGGWYVSPVSIRLRAEDAISGVSSISYRVDGGPWRTYAEPFTLDLDGTRIMEFYGTDAAGNREDIRSMTAKIDRIPPALELAPISNIVTRSAVTIVWSGADQTSGIGEYRYTLDGGDVVSAGVRTSVQLNLSDGTHAIRITAVDNAGNVVDSAIIVQVDTNPFSPSGPYAGAPTYVIIVAAIVVAALAVWRVRKRRSQEK